MNKLSNNLKDHSRFNRWLNNIDEKEKTLSPGVRKRKWILIVAGIVVLFVLSFVFFPAIKIQSEKPDAPFSETGISKQETSPRSAFELPVDSFENHLKSIIYEESAKKK